MKIFYLNKEKKPDTRYHNRYSQFRMLEVPKGYSLGQMRSPELRLIFVIKGKIFINWQREELSTQMISGGEIIFVPQYVDGKAWILEDSTFIVLSCNIPHPLAHKRATEYLFSNSKVVKPPKDKFVYSLPITPNVSLFLRLLEVYIKRKDGVRECDILRYIHQTKEEELYSLFQMEYDSDTLISFLAPGMSTNLHFHSLVLSNYKTCRTIKELAQKCGYDRVRFNALFKECFNATPYRWLNEQTKKLVEDDLKQGDLKIKDIMHNYNFSSFSHFTSFCYRNFGIAPSVLRKKARSEI